MIEPEWQKHCADHDLLDLEQELTGLHSTLPHLFLSDRVASVEWKVEENSSCETNFEN